MFSGDLVPAGPNKVSHLQTKKQKREGKRQDFKIKYSLSFPAIFPNTKVSQEKIKNNNFHVINYTRRNIQWSLAAVSARCARKKTTAGVAAKHI